MTGDLPLWLESAHRAALRSGAARLLEPDFRLALGPHVVGPLLSRTLRGGLFSLVGEGEVLPRVAVEIGLDGEDRAHDVLVEAVGRAAHHGLAQVHALGRDGGLRWAVVERMHGWPLRVLLGRRGLAFTGRRLAALGAELADALRALSAASPDVELVHGRLSVGHVVIDVTGRARLVGSPVAASTPDLTPDAIGLGTTLACAALGVGPDPRGLTAASRRVLSAALDRPENATRMSLPLRRLVQSLILLQPEGFLPSMAVLRAEFARHMEGLPMGVADPAWGRALTDAVLGLPPVHRPTQADAEAVVAQLGDRLPGLLAPPAGRPLSPMNPGGGQRLRLLEQPAELEPAGPPRIDGADLPEVSGSASPRPRRLPLLVR